MTGPFRPSGVRHCCYPEETMSTRQTTDDTRIESLRIGRDDPRYRAVVDKRFNKRFSASPDYVRLVSSTDQVVSAGAGGVGGGRRLAVRRGGGCPPGGAFGTAGGGGRRVCPPGGGGLRT